MKIRIIGKRNNLGIGVHCRNFTDAVLATEWADCVEEIDCEDQAGLVAGGERSEPDDINIVFVSMPIQGHYRGTNIQWIVFESTRVPPTIMSTMLAADQIWVPSAWGRDVLLQNGLGPARCSVVHEGVDPQLYYPTTPPEFEVLTYLITGKYEMRKSIVETVMAWQQEFGNDPAVQLIVKTNHFMNQEQKLQELSNWVNSMGLTNVRILWGEMSNADLIELYQHSNIFVLPSKGEGWGLPLIEAAAMGMPIITTWYSAHTEFLQHVQSSVIPVDYDMIPISCEEYKFFYPTPDNNWGEWAQPRVDSIRRALQHAQQNYTQLKSIAMANSKIIARDFSWTACAHKALALLQAQGLLVKK